MGLLYLYISPHVKLGTSYIAYLQVSRLRLSMSLVSHTFYISRQFLRHFNPNQFKELQKVIKFITVAVV